MRPSLPAADPDPRARARALGESRERYVFDRSIGGLPLAAKVPDGEAYTAPYLLGAGRVEAMLLDGRVRAGTDPRLEDERAAWRKALVSGSDGVLATLRSMVKDSRNRGVFAAPLLHASTLNDYDALFDGLPVPTSRPHAESDAFFAWQRVAGCNPAALRQLTAREERLPVTDAHFRAAVADAGDSLDRARDEGRLFLLDHTSLEGLPTQPSYGFDRYVYGPLALFVRTLAGPLMPVAVRFGATSTAPVATPADGNYWRHARLVVQTADAAAQGLAEHLGMCHVFANAVLMCTGRELAPQHPVRVLLWPHFEMTLAANETMKTAVIGQGGFVDQLQGPTLDAGIQLAARAWRDRSVRDHDLPRDLELRGVADATTLPIHPYREDARAVHDALGRWVRDYLALYYTTEAALAQDVELAAWYAALGSSDGGGLSDLHAIGTREGLAELVTAILFRVTGYHAVINYGGYDFFSWPNTLPTARWGPAPSSAEGLDEASLLDVLPPLGLAEHTLDLMLPQRELRLNTLGRYPPKWFEDPAVAPLVQALQDRLDAAEAGIARRDAERPWSFPYLRPSRIAQSIHV